MSQLEQRPSSVTPEKLAAMEAGLASHLEGQASPATEMPEVAETQVDKAKKKRGLSRRTTAGIALGSLVLAGGGVVANRLLSGGEAEPSGSGNTPVMGADRYVDYSAQNNDRNNDGYDDANSDVNGNFVMDDQDTWDQQTGEFVDSRAGDDEAALENASPEDLARINEIRSAYPGIDDNPHWVADFVGLEDRVKNYLMNVLHSPEDFESSDQWHMAIDAAFSITAEELEQIANS